MTRSFPIRVQALVVLLIVCGFGVSARADRGPVFSASDLALEEDGLPEGWRIVYEDHDGTPGTALESWARAIARTSGLDEADLRFATRVVRGPNAEAATLLIVEAGGDDRAFPEDLVAEGRKAGYLVRELGHESRLLVLAAPAPARPAVLEMQLAYSIRTLVRIAFERLERGSFVGATAFARGARAIDAKAGAPLVVLGMVAVREGRLADAIESFRTGLGGDATRKATGRLSMRGWAYFGKTCLMRKDPALDREAREALAQAVALEAQAASGKDPLFVQRYNLACAHARLEEFDEAQAQLQAAFEMLRLRAGADTLRTYVEQRLLDDEDFRRLHAHSGCRAVIEKARKDAASGG